MQPRGGASRSGACDRGAEDAASRSRRGNEEPARGQRAEKPAGGHGVCAMRRRPGAVGHLRARGGSQARALMEPRGGEQRGGARTTTGAQRLQRSSKEPEGSGDLRGCWSGAAMRTAEPSWGSAAREEPPSRRLCRSSRTELVRALPARTGGGLEKARGHGGIQPRLLCPRAPVRGGACKLNGEAWEEV